MKGVLLKRFLISCEARGIVSLKLDGSLLSIEDELEEIWGNLTTSSCAIEDCVTSVVEQEHNCEVPFGIIDSMIDSPVSPCCNEELDDVSFEADISSGCHDNTGQQFDYDTKLENDTVSTQNDLSTNEVDTKGSGSELASPHTPLGSASNTSIPADLLDISTPILSAVEPSPSPEVPQPTSSLPFCSTPAVESLPLKDQGSILMEPENSMEYTLPTIMLSSDDKDSASQSCYVTCLSQDGNDVASSAYLQSPECQPSKSQKDSEFPSVEEASVGSDPLETFMTPCAKGLNVSSSDDDSDGKLEQLFSRIKLQSDRKKVSKVAFRRSLSEFIVSDSEDVVTLSDDEGPLTPKISPVDDILYHTPCTPAAGLMFWGSPSGNSFHPPRGKSLTCVRDRTPLAEKSNLLTPSVSKPRAIQPLTTPSAHKHYPRHKNNMLSELFTLFNKTVFDNKLLGVKVTWNNRLCTSAGYCRYKGMSTSRTAEIELATKVCDSFDRLRDTLAHELCHAACWVIDGTKGAKHGPKWRAWADKVLAEHPGLQPITRCHDYSIAFKYSYKCVRCDFKFGRHSKSVNLKTACCPRCESELELEPRLKRDGTPYAPRKLNSYAQFLKENYSIVKSSSPYQTHAQILEKINYMYQQSKAETLGHNTSSCS